MPSSLNKGSDYEKEVQERYNKEGWRTHRVHKSRFGQTDVLGIADICATKNDAFLLIACAVGRAQTNTVQKIKEIRPFIPPYIGIKYYIQRANGKEEIRNY